MRHSTTGRRHLELVRAINECALDGIGGELEGRWPEEDDEERPSLQDLAEEVNRKLLTAAMEEAGMQSVDASTGCQQQEPDEHAIAGCPIQRRRRRPQWWSTRKFASERSELAGRSELAK